LRPGGERRETLAYRAAAGQRCTVSRKTTRTKIALCVGLLLLAAAPIWRFLAQPVVEVSFVRYDGPESAVLGFTNRGRSLIHCSGEDLSLVARSDPVSRIPISFSPSLDLMPRSGTQVSVLTKSLELPATVALKCFPELLTLRRRVDFVVLNFVGIDIANTGFVATVTLPPRETASPSPAH